jgi:class 3 adenylate cyclase/tetratricopeptide (TPR) repeat protein
MNCPRCQTQIPADGVFCDNCGSRLEAACPSCSEANRLGAKFCKKCGQGLAEAAAAPVTPKKFGSPETYTPKHLADKILTSKSALEGERKQVTVLFADMKGSMELLADRDPEDARKILDPVLEHMMEAVHRYEGTVNQVMGDGIMALFGAPLAHEDHAVRACYAALAMQSVIRRYSEELRRSHGIEVQIRIGLNSGEVVVRAIGSDLRMDYSAIGQTTHLAARMEQLAPPGNIRLMAVTLKLAEGFVQVNSLGLVPVKGLSEPMEVFDLLGAAPIRTRFRAITARGLTRFVGRQAEIQALSQALERARAGHGQVVAPVGEAGVGKSRLFWEFTRSHRTQGWLLLESGSVSYGKATPYLPIIDLLKTYFKIQDRDDHREIGEKVTGKLLTLDRSLEITVPAFLTLLDVPVDDPTWQSLDPPQRRLRTLDAVQRLMLRESQVQPLLLVLEDLHWIDSETQALLDNLVESLPTARILLLVNYRPEYLHSWSNKTYYTQLHIDPLPPENAEELLTSLLGHDTELKSLKQLLVEHTEGNPFFLEESIRTLEETKVLIGERGNYRLEKKVESMHVPATVQAVLASRIDRLPLEEKQLLQSAAVIGKDVPFRLLRAITEVPEEELRHGLARLQAAEFLYETSLFPDLEYTFKHALTHDVTYESLLRDRQRALHARIVDAIEALYPDRLIEQVERLAHHAVRGEVWGKSLTYLRQAGSKADNRSALREAASYFEQALTALAHLPESRELREQAIDLHFNLRISLAGLGERERLLEHLRAAESLANALGDERRLARVSLYIARELSARGEHEEAVTACERAIGMARILEDYGLEVLATFFMGQAYYCLGNYPKAVEAQRRNLVPLYSPVVRERFGGLGLPFAFSRSSLALALAERGEFVEAAVQCTEAIHIAEAVGHPFSVTTTYRAMGLLHLRWGNLYQATLALERALEICQGVDSPPLFHAVSSTLGYAYALSGRSAEAIPILEEAVERPAVTGTVEGKSLRTRRAEEVLRGTLSLSEAYLLAGREGDARAAAQRALGLARQNKERGHEAFALRLLGEIASHKDSHDIGTAQEHYHQALALAEELGMRPLVAHCHVGLGKLYRQSGNLPLVKEHLYKGIALMREMEMGLWLENAEAGLKELG